MPPAQVSLRMKAPRLLALVAALCCAAGAAAAAPAPHVRAGAPEGNAHGGAPSDAFRRAVMEPMLTKRQRLLAELRQPSGLCGIKDVLEWECGLECKDFGKELEKLAAIADAAEISVGPVVLLPSSGWLRFAPVHKSF